MAADAANAATNVLAMTVVNKRDMMITFRWVPGMATIRSYARRINAG
jgi:hypothetical protein